MMMIMMFGRDLLPSPECVQGGGRVFVFHRRCDRKSDGSGGRLAGWTHGAKVVCSFVTPVQLPLNTEVSTSL